MTNFKNTVKSNISFLQIIEVDLIESHSPLLEF